LPGGRGWTGVGAGGKAQHCPKTKALEAIPESAQADQAGQIVPFAYRHRFCASCYRLTTHPELSSPTSATRSAAFQASLIVPPLNSVTWNTSQLGPCIGIDSMATNNMHNLTTLIKRYCHIYILQNFPLDTFRNQQSWTTKWFPPFLGSS